MTMSMNQLHRIKELQRKLHESSYAEDEGGALEIAMQIEIPNRRMLLGPKVLVVNDTEKARHNLVR